MTRLEKLRDQEANKHGTEFRKREIYKDGFNASSAEYEKIIKDLQEALVKYSRDERRFQWSSGSPDFKTAKDALQKLKDFRGINE